jgi:multidrug efflux pump
LLSAALPALLMAAGDPDAGVAGAGFKALGELGGVAEIPGVDKRSMITGFSLIDNGFKTNAATFFITFKPFGERYADIATAKAQNARAILTAFYDEAKHIREAMVLPIAPPSIPGIGTTGGFEFWIQDTAAGSPIEP